MPFYDYECQSCGFEMEKRQEMSEKPIKKCPSCKKNKLQRVITAINFSVRQEVKTIGQALDRKQEKLGKYEKESIIQKNEIEKEKRLAKMEEEGIIRKKPKKPNNWYGEMPKDKVKEITKISDKKERKKRLKKYIITGE